MSAEKGSCTNVTSWKHFKNVSIAKHVLKQCLSDHPEVNRALPEIVLAGSWGIPCS